MHRVIFIAGFPSSGKTTFYNQDKIKPIAKKRNYQNHDAVLKYFKEGKMLNLEY